LLLPVWVCGEGSRPGAGTKPGVVGVLCEGDTFDRPGIASGGRIVVPLGVVTVSGRVGETCAWATPIEPNTSEAARMALETVIASS
jgi:hypothetical protein